MQTSKWCIIFAWTGLNMDPESEWICPCIKRMEQDLLFWFLLLNLYCLYYLVVNLILVFILIDNFEINLKAHHTYDVFFFKQSAAWGERDPRICASTQRASEGIRVELGTLDEDKGNIGTRHLGQGEQSKNRFTVLHGHAQRIPNGSKSRTNFPNAYMLGNFKSIDIFC
jgi:hypothetical protein